MFIIGLFAIGLVLLFAYLIWRIFRSIWTFGVVGNFISACWWGIKVVFLFGCLLVGAAYTVEVFRRWFYYELMDERIALGSLSLSLVVNFLFGYFFIRDHLNKKPSMAVKRNVSVQERPQQPASGVPAAHVAAAPAPGIAQPQPHVVEG